MKIKYKVKSDYLGWKKDVVPFFIARWRFYLVNFVACKNKKYLLILKVYVKSLYDHASGLSAWLVVKDCSLSIISIRYYMLMIIGGYHV